MFNFTVHANIDEELLFAAPAVGSDCSSASSAPAVGGGSSIGGGAPGFGGGASSGASSSGPAVGGAAVRAVVLTSLNLAVLLPPPTAGALLLHHYRHHLVSNAARSIAHAARLVSNAFIKENQRHRQPIVVTQIGA